MCGIIGIIDKSRDSNREVLEEMSACIHHRGPDDAGIFIDEDAGVYLAHRRLSLIDLSSAGHQPMQQDNLVISYNGEIYNFQEIRQELAALGVQFVSNSDTEVLLAAWQEWGEDAIAKCRGMFAFIIYNKSTKELYVYRDRLGVKPLYYYYDDTRFICASELGALVQHPAIVREIDTDAVALYLQQGYIPAPYSIYKNIYKLEPGHRLTIDRDAHVSKEQYWQLDDYYQHKSPQSQLSEKELLEELESKISEGCNLRMIADVPVGVFLSGGIDSSLVTALLVKQGYTNLSTFTIGFKEAEFDESVYARDVAEYLGTSHHEYICTTREAQEIVPKLPEIYGEPFADAAAIPTVLLSQYTKQEVTASLSADGGDELFGGYARYRSGQNIYTKFAHLPKGLYPLVLVARGALVGLSRVGILPARYRHKFAKALLFYRARNNLSDTYAVQHSYFSDQEIDRLLVRPANIYTTNIFAQYLTNKVSHLIRRLQHIDIHTYLPDDILAKVDRASMAHSLESREPLLDHQVWEYVAGLSDSQLGYEQNSKHLLREILYKHIPRKLVDRPKQGFGVPLDKWLRGDLRYLLDEYLAQERIEKAGLLDYQAVSREKEQFLAGAQSYNRIWNILVLHMWYEKCYYKMYE
ncbi:MAG: asparagine synthase (glutamine-hydrolyzing) [Patescibacteria group bacterium]